MSLDRGIITVAIAVIFIVLAMMGSRWFLSSYLGIPWDKVPMIIKLLVQGLIMYLIFIGVRKFFKS